MVIQRDLRRVMREWSTNQHLFFCENTNYSPSSMSQLILTVSRVEASQPKSLLQFCSAKKVGSVATPTDFY